MGIGLWYFILFLIARYPPVKGVKVGEACTPSSTCEGGSQCSSPTQGGTCECPIDTFMDVNRCLSLDSICVQSRLVVRAGTSTSLPCNGLASTDIVTWHYGPNKYPGEIGNCPAFSVNGTTCTAVPGSTWTLHRAETSSALTFTPVAKPTDGQPGDMAICKVGSVEKHRWVLDIYSYTTTSVSSPTWLPGRSSVISGTIQMINFTSSQNCYSECQWYQQVNKQSKTSINASRDIQAVGSTGLRNVTCSFSLPVPSVSATYTYTFEMPKVLTQTFAYQLIHPPPPYHDCPAIVPEGDDLQCTCIPKENGVPTRTFTWLGTIKPSSTLRVANVSRNNHNTVYTCADQSGYSLANYTLRVAYGPAKVFIAATKSLKDPNGLTLVCLAQDCYPSPTLTWLDSGKSLGQGPFLEVDSNHLHKEWGVHCEASNSEMGNSKVIGTIHIFQVLQQLNYSGAWEGSLDPNQTSFGKGVVTGVGIMLALLLVGALTAVLVLRHKKRSLRTMGKKSKSKAEEERRVHLVDITSLCPSRSRDSEESQEGIPTDSRGLPEGASNYDALDGTQVKTVYPYSSLVMGAPSDKGHHSQTQPQPDIAQAEDPVYANSKQVLEDSELAIYANS